MSQENSSLDPEAKQLSFEKARYDYSIKMFENEASRKQSLETKAQFYLTFVTAFLTAIFLSLPYLTVLQGFMHNKAVNQTWREVITALLVGLGLGLLFSLLSVLFAMKLQKYRAEYPQIPYPALFSSKHYEENNEAELLKYTAQEAVRALQKNQEINDRKAQYVKAASFGILFAVLMLALLVGISVYLQVLVVPPTPTKTVTILPFLI